MSRINTILKALKEKNVNSYKIYETKTSSIEQFFVLQKLETSRLVETLEDNVTIYITKEENNKKYLGTSNFLISKNASKKEIEAQIDEAIYAASFVNNEYYELVKGIGKKTIKTPKLKEDGYQVLQNIANIYFKCSTDNVKFNSLELFLIQKENHLITSNNVDYKNTSFDIKIEAIPSYKSDDFKTELYRMKEYAKIDYQKIEKDAQKEVLDIMNRAGAKTITQKGPINVIIKDQEIAQIMWEIISPYNLSSVYNKTNTKVIGDKIHENSGSKISLSLKTLNKADFFDSNGVLLKERLIIENGVLKDYYGNSRFAYYLQKEPSGELKKIKLGCGNYSLKDLKKEPYIELIDLSGIQADFYASYLGGEVRLANYFDGKEIYPISGFSFSVNLQDALDNMMISKEKTDSKYYEGPKAVLIKNAKIN